MQNTPENTYDDRVYSTHPKITKKKKRYHLVSFWRETSLWYISNRVGKP